MSRNVLVTAGSRRVPLVRAFQRALGLTGGGDVIVTDVNDLSPTVYLADRACQVPLSTDPGYVEALAQICRTEDVGLLVPTIDDELTVIAEAVGRFAEAGVAVAVSPPETTRVGNDKLLTAAILSAHGVAVAETWLPDDPPADLTFPLFVKPRRGRGGVAAYAARTAHELQFFSSYVPDAVIQTYLDGPEFTIDLLADFNGRVLSVVPRERVVVRAGVVDRGRTLRDEALIDLGLACAEVLRFAGAVNIQARVVDGRPVIFEINPRFSGGIPLTIAAGADFPLVLVQLARGIDVRPFIGRFQSDLWMTTWETSLFLPARDVGFPARMAVPAIPEVA